MVTQASDRLRLLSTGSSVTVAGRRYAVAWRGGSESRPLMRLEGVDDRAGAEGLRGQALEVSRDEFGPLEPGEHLVRDLVGCEVFDGSRRVGVVREVVTLPSVDCLEVERGEGPKAGEPLLVPMVSDAVRSVDPHSRHVTSTWRSSSRSEGAPARMVIDVFSLFPESFGWFTRQRHVRNALRGGHDLRLFNYRDTTPLSHGQVDDTPFGGGAGMVIRVDVVDAALQAAYGSDTEAMLASRRVVVLTPAGRQLDDPLVHELAAEPRLTLLCGRYEGVDDRVRTRLANDAISIGPYVLSGGELAAMVVADAVMRKLPGALGDEHSAVEESFSDALGGAPEYPQFTRPASYRGWDVPDVLLSGHHERVREWRREEVAKLRGGTP